MKLVQIEPVQHKETSTHYPQRHGFAPLPGSPESGSALFSFVQLISFAARAWTELRALGVISPPRGVRYQRHLQPVASPAETQSGRPPTA
jgi:hypothetical protein